MPKFLIREVHALVFHVEAASEEEALKKHFNRAPRDFDEIECGHNINALPGKRVSAPELAEIVTIEPEED